MKKIIWIFLSFLILAIGCKPKTKEVIEETWPDGSPKIVKSYKIENGSNEVLLGETWYYENGKKEKEGKYIDSLMHGTWIYWYDNGNKWVEGNFNKGKEEGIYTTYFENGQKRYEGKFIDGVRVGEWLFWDEEGVIRKKVNYDE